MPTLIRSRVLAGGGGKRIGAGRLDGWRSDVRQINAHGQRGEDFVAAQPRAACRAESLSAVAAVGKPCA